ncbi:tRNA (guanosine(46)-N7)-methyltransferase TrmB [Candidatus Saccharibacteria bacterium]|nr:MAG: tRNA (guanosine(46)-N7)-methyltransferase TrmB [Candidatus Saccharibacteria bacterium]
MPGVVDPNDFIITRKRKKYKFAKFHNAPNCFELSQWSKRPANIVEVGAGSALFSVELAARHPDKTIVALDVKADRLQHGAYKAIERGISNVYFVRARADQIDELFEPTTVEQLWVTFPDPYPKRRSAARRLTHPNFLKKYSSLLSPTGALCVKHDSRDFFCWSLEQLVAERWAIQELSFDLHDSPLPDDYKIITTYEERWRSTGLVTHFVKAGKRVL